MEIQTKTFEVRDEGTMIVVLASRLHVGSGATPQERMWRRRGFRGEVTLLWPLSGGEQTYDPFYWHGHANSTLFEAHRHIRECWDDLEDGALIDVEVLLGLRDEPKTSEFQR